MRKKTKGKLATYGALLLATIILFFALYKRFGPPPADLPVLEFSSIQLQGENTDIVETAVHEALLRMGARQVPRKMVLEGRVTWHPKNFFLEQGMYFLEVNIKSTPGYFPAVSAAVRSTDRTNQIDCARNVADQIAKRFKSQLAAQQKVKERTVKGRKWIPMV